MSSPLWHDTLCAGDVMGATRSPLPGNVDADVAIVGAGYTGLWTAHYLLATDPGLRVVVVEAEHVGFGASGRNGGWCSAITPMSVTSVARHHGADAAVRLQRAMNDTVVEVGRASAEAGIDCQFHRGGYLSLARTPPQVERARRSIATWRAFGFGADDHRWMDAGEARSRVAASDVLGATYTPHCAAIHPARLVRGLAEAVERAGATIYESTPVTRIEPRRLSTDRGQVRADVVVRATEAYTARLPGTRREIVPVYSLMVATEPLSRSLLDGIGWAGRETLDDGRKLIVYAQRTADGRVAFGGRGSPYHFASAIRPEHELDRRVHRRIEQTLVEIFPALAGVGITHRWGGPIGIPRDWHCSVGYEPTTGLAWAGGYVGDGVATANLAGRTIADLVTNRASDLTTLPWVQHRSRRWEPEPLRWLGVNAMLRLPASIDRYELRTGREERWRTAVLERLR